MTVCPTHGCPACAVAAPRPGPGDRATKALNDFLGGFSAQARAVYGPTSAEWAEVNEEEVDE